MKILLFGKNGQVGWELNRSLQPLGDVIALGRGESDFSSPENLRKIVRDIKPNVIVNAAAYTAVDKAEDEEELALIINAHSSRVLAEEALKINSLLVYYSTDYVFDGTKKEPYTEEDEPNPVNAYGRTKLAGELAIKNSGCDYLIFRTSWVYSSRGCNFLLTILRLAKERDELSVVSDQIGSPTSARLIADITCYCLNQAMKRKWKNIFVSDLYNLTASGHTSWQGFAKEIVSTAQESDLNFTADKIKAIPTDDYPSLAQRPINSRLMLNKLEHAFDVKMPDWKYSLQLCLDEILEV